MFRHKYNTFRGNRPKLPTIIFGMRSGWMDCGWRVKKTVAAAVASVDDAVAAAVGATGRRVRNDNLCRATRRCCRSYGYDLGIEKHT